MIETLTAERDNARGIARREIEGEKRILEEKIASLYQELTQNNAEKEMLMSQLYSRYNYIKVSRTGMKMKISIYHMKIVQAITININLVHYRINMLISILLIRKLRLFIMKKKKKCFSRVKLIITQKVLTIKNLSKELEGVNAKCGHLEKLLDQQRKEYILKSL